MLSAFVKDFILIILKWGVYLGMYTWGIRAPGVGVTGKPSSVGAGNWTQILGTAKQTPNHMGSCLTAALQTQATVPETQHVQ